ncbi:hypothetical protein CLOM_g7060 [Closterium sp. NIES-68]|nr:hypothetical protein CLOM_g7060 [Closterium sp. NIES-68]
MPGRIGGDVRGHALECPTTCQACVGHRVTMLMVMSAIVARVASSHDTLFIPLEPREKLSQGHSAGKSVAV